jgi:hypothetical protein
MVTTGITIKTPTGTLPLVASPEQIGSVLGKTGRAVRLDCEAGTIPTLPRAGGDGGHWRIPVAKWLDAVGIPYEFVGPGIESDDAA